MRSSTRPSDEAGYVNVAKQFSGKRVSTWYSLTDLERQRFGQYKESLDRILGGVPSG